MEIYISGRQCGKTTMLIKESARTGAMIAVATYTMVNYVVGMAKQMGLDIPQPVTYADIFRNFRENKTKRYLVDELQIMLSQLNIDASTMNLGTEPHQIKYSPRVYILDERHRVTSVGLKRAEEDSWHPCSYSDMTLLHDGTWKDGKWYEWIDIHGNIEYARMKLDAYDHFNPRTFVIKEEEVMAFRERRNHESWQV